MRITTTATSKGQITIPKSIRTRLGLKPGMRVDMFATHDGFIGRIKRPENIFRFGGDLAHKDMGEPLSVIRQKAQTYRARSIAKKAQR